MNYFIEIGADVNAEDTIDGQTDFDEIVEAEEDGKLNVDEKGDEEKAFSFQGGQNL